MMDKKQQWAVMKEQCPDVAEFLVRFNGAFGKPSALRVEILSSGKVIESGQFGKSRMVYDGKQRTRARNGWR